MRIQPHTRQKKRQLSARAITAVNDAVTRDSIRWQCSKSWIIHTALAAFYNIDIVKPFEVGKVVHIRKRA